LTSPTGRASDGAHRPDQNRVRRAARAAHLICTPVNI